MSLAFAAGVALTFFIVMQTMLTAATRSVDGGLPYKTTSAIFMQELIKLTFACWYWFTYDYRGGGYNGLGRFTVRNFAMFAIPGMTYALQNSFVYIAITLLGPPTFQVFSNFKIITTAILFSWVLKRRLTVIQWLSVVLLFMAMVVAKLGMFFESEEDSAWGSRGEFYFGCILLIINSTLSAFSGICNEWLIKKIDPEAPLQFKNMQLYFFGVVLNILGGLVQSRPAGNGGFFAGFTPTVWIIVLNNAALGISVSYIMKYANNLVKCFTGAVAVYIASTLSAYFFDEKIDVSFMCGVVVFSIAFYLYFGDHNNILKREWQPVPAVAPAPADVEMGERTNGDVEEVADLLEDDDVKES